jgi:hypothetical protein
LNFAFNTVLLFLIFFSGLAFLRAYHSKEFSKNYIKKNTFDELVGGIFSGIFFQIVSVLYLTKYHEVQFDFKSLGFLLIGAKDDANISSSFLNVQSHIWKIFQYNICVIGFAAICGLVCRYLVRWLKLDRKWHFFRFSNEWHYILSGEILEFPSRQIRSEKSKSRRISAKDISNKYLNVLFRSMIILSFTREYCGNTFYLATGGWT